MNESEWKSVQDISFSGGGDELEFSLDKSFYDEKGRLPRDATAVDNQEYEGTLSFETEAGFGIGPADVDVDLEVGKDWRFVQHSFKHSINNDDSSVGFVLSDPDPGDHFDVKIGIDKKYGSFVFFYNWRSLQVHQ